MVDRVGDSWLSVLVTLTLAAAIWSSNIRIVFDWKARLETQILVWVYCMKLVRGSSRENDFFSNIDYDSCVANQDHTYGV